MRVREEKENSLKLPFNYTFLNSMSSTDPSWEWYRSFLQVLDSGSLSGAARELALTQPTVGRHVNALEQALGLSLFTRSPEGLTPTAAALELKPYAIEIASSAAALQRAASGLGEGVRGTVRIAASEVIGIEVLPPILTQLREQHPQLVIELSLSNSAHDLLRREADIAVRMFSPRQDALLARRIGSIELGLHAHKRYLERFGVPQTLKDLEHHTLIGFDEETAFIRSVLPRVKSFSRDRLALRANSDLAQLAAIRAGFGLGICQVPLASTDANLVRVLGNDLSLPLDTWVAMHENLREDKRCAVTFQALVAGLQAYLSSTAT